MVYTLIQALAAGSLNSRSSDKRDFRKNTEYYPCSRTVNVRIKSKKVQKKTRIVRTQIRVTYINYVYKAGRFI